MIALLSSGEPLKSTTTPFSTPASPCPFQAAAQVHPGMLDVADAQKIAIPFCTFGSEEEPADKIEEYGNNLANQTDKLIRQFPDQKHGFMSARGDLADPAVRAQYERAYQLVLDFFVKHLG